MDTITGTQFMILNNLWMEQRCHLENSPTELKKLNSGHLKPVHLWITDEELCIEERKKKFYGLTVKFIPSTSKVSFICLPGAIRCKYILYHKPFSVSEQWKWVVLFLQSHESYLRQVMLLVVASFIFPSIKKCFSVSFSPLK